MAINLSLAMFCQHEKMKSSLFDPIMILNGFVAKMALKSNAKSFNAYRRFMMLGCKSDYRIETFYDVSCLFEVFLSHCVSSSDSLIQIAQFVHPVF